jgi:hypothetical protein
MSATVKSIVSSPNLLFQELLAIQAHEWHNPQQLPPPFGKEDYYDQGDDSPSKLIKGSKNVLVCFIDEESMGDHDENKRELKITVGYYDHGDEREWIGVIDYDLSEAEIVAWAYLKNEEIF